MRPGNNNRRGRNRGQRKQHGGIPNKNQSYDGGGSETRVRGNVYQVLEKYLQLARDAGVSGDRIAAENYLQHADHYYRVIQSMNDGQRPRVGGRDISVADFNVQNVSQGLSAALYTGGQAPQPNLNDAGGNQGQPQGNGGNAASGGNGNGNSAEGGDDDDGDDGEEGEAPPQQQHQPRNNQRGRHNNRHGQYNNGQHAQNGQNNPGPDPERQKPVAERPTEEPTLAAQPAAAQPAAPAPRIDDEQPSYPEDLLPPVAVAAEAPARDEGRGGPRPRGRLRARRPRAEAEDAPAEPALPGVEGGE
jgi:hypothetical protein